MADEDRRRELRRLRAKGEIMQVVLEIKSGTLAGKKIRLKSGGSARIGRTSKSDYAFGDDSMMSSVHFAVEWDGKVCRVVDQNSRNGTAVNGKKINTAELKEGDEISSGKTRFSVHFETEGAPRQPSTVSPLGVPPATSPASRRSEPIPPLGAPPQPGQSAPRPPQQQPIPSIPVAPLPTSPIPKTVAPPPLAPLPAAPKPIATLPLPKPVMPAPGAEAARRPDEPVPPELTPQERLLQMLREGFQPLYALLDASKEPDVLKVLFESKEEYQSLFEGPRGQMLAHFAPYLVRLTPKSPLLEILVEKGWGKSWGVFLTCEASLKDLRAHFRHFLMVKLPDGKQVYFRFYDPRVLRAYLPTCLPEEINTFFGPVKCFVTEDENPDVLLRFTNSGKGPGRKELPLASGSPIAAIQQNASAGAPGISPAR